MRKITDNAGRRQFIKTATSLTTGLAGIAMFPQQAFALDPVPDDSIHIVGPKEGFSPHIGTLVSMMNWMRMIVLRSVEKLDKDQLDYLHDPASNTIGAMLMHLVATEVFYRGNTFEGRKDFSDADKAKWGDAMQLGDRGRQTIKGNDINYYLDVLKENRTITLAEFKKRDDKWLMTIDPSFFGNQPTNNYCKWFHVCEHESNHNGQIKWIKSRLPGVKGGND